MLVHVAARPAGIIRRVILQRLRQRVGAELADRDAPGVDRHVRHRLQHEETGDRPLLIRGEAAVARVLEVVVQQPRVGDHRDGAEADVREAAPRNDAVEQAGVVVGDLVVLVRPARAAPADGVLRRAVAFHEALLHHHHGLGRQHVVAVVGVDVEAGGGDRVPLAEHDVVGHAARAVTLPEPAVHAAAAEGVDEPPVPAGRRGPGVRCGGRRLVQHRDLVDRAVDRAGLDAHDVRHGRPGQRGRGCEIGRPCGRIGERLQLAVRGSVDVVDAAVDGAVVVERRAQRLAPRQLERLGLADERLLMRAGEHRAFDRVVHERERAPRRAVGACQQQLAGAGQPLHQPHQHARRRRPEGGGDVFPAERDAQTGQIGVRCGGDAHQGVPAGHHVRTAGQDLQLVRTVARIVTAHDAGADSKCNAGRDDHGQHHPRSAATIDPGQKGKAHG